MAFCAAIAFASCDNKQKNDQQALLDASKQELATALSERDTLLSLMTDITTATNQIKQTEGILSVMNQQHVENPTQKQQLLANLAAIQQTLQERRERLAQLEKQLQSSKLYNKKLQSSIDAMKAQIAQQDKEIESLKAQLDEANRTIGTLRSQADSLNTTVANVSQELSTSQSNAKQLSNELNTCYYVVATKKELKKHKILESGFLKKTKLMKGDFDKAFFTAGDKRTLNTLVLKSSKVKILSSHPANSYQIVEQGGKKTLHITAPKLFWDQSNYLVIQIN